VRGHGHPRAEPDRRIGAPALLDVGDPAGLEDPQPGAPVRDGAQVGDDQRGQLAQVRRLLRIAGQLPQVRAHRVATVGKPGEQLP